MCVFYPYFLFCLHQFLLLKPGIELQQTFGDNLLGNTAGNVLRWEYTFLAVGTGIRSESAFQRLFFLGCRLSDVEMNIFFILTPAVTFSSHSPNTSRHVAFGARNACLVVKPPTTRRTPHATSRLVHAVLAWLAKPRRAPSRHCRDVGFVFLALRTMVMHGTMNTPPPPTTFLEHVIHVTVPDC